MKRFRSIRNYANEKNIHDDNHKKFCFFVCRNGTISLFEKISMNSRAYFQFKKKALEIYGPKCYSKATYDLKTALIKHPSFQLLNVNNGYNDTRGNGTKWSSQNQIKSEIKNQIRKNTLS